MEEKEYELLDRVHTPQDIKDIREEDLPQFVDECRDWLIHAVSKTGGHLAASLGVAEITVAAHYVFDSPRDKMIWDVGHQAYIHKMLTGRRDHFPSIRQWKGMSGFLRRDESEHDAFGAGHGGTSISAALGMNEAKHQQGQRHKSIAIIGDGSFTCGMAFEAMNHAGHLGRDLIVILNDNEWGISPNVGAVGQFLNRNVTSKSFVKLKREVKKWVVNNAGTEVAQRIGRFEDAVKTAFLPGSALFEAFGFDYMGPVDGHDVHEMVRVLRAAKASSKPILIHAYTQKGHGWEVAEADPLTYHGLGKYNPDTGEIQKGTAGGPPSYTNVFAQAAIELADADESIVAITAAMPTGTGLNKFEQAHPKRTYDVGMCEQHGVTFAAGMAAEGMHPIVAIYSTFLQRGYDQVVHDVCLQKLPVVFAMDRAGLVGADGATHMGLYDISYMRSLPNMVVMAPKDENELRHMLKTAVYCGLPAAVRYPRGNGQGVEIEPMRELPLGKGELLEEGGDIAIIAYGTPVNFAMEAAK
ncbi:MAG: 1-deoxy-D-xylulose-5-phosphate synthase, partial [Chrysiogenetes bacterium]|nr:1-deoxy-D-xylulose-5-phosphate synthase [Chrysiogenetes bacterium]